jgi:hypothetical protein
MAVAFATAIQKTAARFVVFGIYKVVPRTG